MSTHTTPNVSTLIVEEEIQLTLVELCQACNAPAEYVTAWVYEGVLTPSGQTPEAFADMYGLPARQAAQMLERARQRRAPGA